MHLPLQLSAATYDNGREATTITSAINIHNNRFFFIPSNLHFNFSPRASYNKNTIDYIYSILRYTSSQVKITLFVLKHESIVNESSRRLTVIRKFICSRWLTVRANKPKTKEQTDNHTILKP